MPWLVVLSREEKRGRAFLSGLVFGVAYWCASVPWIAYVVTNFGGQSRFMGWVCVLLTALHLSQWPALVAFAAVAGTRAGSLLRLLAFPVLWTAGEHARATVYGGFPWNLTGFALYRHPIWIQAASVGGVYLVAFLAWVVSALIAATVVRKRWSFLAAAAVLALGTGLTGALRLAGPEPPGPPLTAALLQPAIPQEQRLDPASAPAAYRAVIEQAREAAAGRPGLIVIPESAFPTYWEVSPTLRRDLTEIAAACGCPVLFNDVETEASGRYYNAARLAGASGLLGPVYRKVHLVPFGEFVPLPKVFFFVRQVSTEIGEFSPAPEPTLLSAGDLRIGMGVCYEITYDGLSRAEVELGANLLATISNDSWYGKAGAQPQHFAGAVLRSGETGRFLLRAAVTGITGAVDDRGRILAELGPDRRGTVRAVVRLQTGPTAWTRLGHVFPLAADGLAAAVLLFGVAGLVRRRSGLRADGTPPSRNA